MAVFKCKMCGGDLDVVEGIKVYECDYCGTKQTVAAADDEKKVNLFNRANSLRINNEFDKAEAIYESILGDFPDEAEAYWGICLCKYGIEYVDDPRTKTKIPTCHRTSFKSIYEDASYLKTLELSDALQRQVYCAEAHVIDELQRDILKVVHSVEPYDIFICYKETDAYGQRTKDSVLAQDMYDALTAKGYKVFFSRITLEDKLGKQYEPYIFAALNSARIMLSVGTKPEHFEAVWVKNEWSRYLSLMEEDREKTLIPCYCDMNPYDMPSEFRNLQGQDMGKLGFIQDLVRGIGKILGESNPQSQPMSAPASQPYMGIATFESTVAAHVGPALIGRVGAIGTNNSNDTWPSGSMSSTIDLSQFSVIMFQIYLRQPLGYYGQATLGYAVFDPNGNVLNSDECVFAVEADYDRFSQGIVLRGNDGTKVQTGQYRAVFWVNDSQAAVFNFTVIESGNLFGVTNAISNIGNSINNAFNTNNNGFNNGYNNNGFNNGFNNYNQPYQKTKSKSVAAILALFAGSIGLHDFYLNHKVRGIIRIVLSFTGYGAVFTSIWAFIDFIRIIIGNINCDADGVPLK